MYYGEALEKLLDVSKIVSNPTRYFPNYNGDVGWLMWFCRQHLKLCVPFWWANNLIDAVAQSGETYPSDVSVSRDKLFCDHGWCYFETPGHFSSSPFSVAAVSWNYVGSTHSHDPSHDCNTPALIVIAYGYAKHYLIPLSATRYHENEHNLADYQSRIEHFREFPDGHNAVELQAEFDLLRFVLAAGAWLRQRILTVHEERPNHQTRKTIKRDFGNIAVPNIQVVQLRRSASTSHDSAAVSERDWHCQWMVRGHWRNQYYASSGDHMPKYIHPYIKGPEDKPLKPPSGEIFAVTR